MPNRVDELSEREEEILRLVATGASNKQIAQELFISANTVKVHLRNIFAKIEVASRTEATLYAIREGIITAPFPAQLPPAENGNAPAELVPVNELPTNPSSSTAIAIPTRPIDRWLRQPLALLLSVAALFVVGALGFSLIRPNTPAPAANPSPVPTLSRWEERAPMPEARSGLAAAVYEGQIYAIAGETSGDVTGSVTRYDPQTDTWASLAPKPLPVADVGAALIGEKIYVPGGRTAAGKPVDALEVYDPRRDRWESKASLPRPISAYSLAAFEGKLYIFGGWDGDQYLDTTYEYDPAADAWQERTPMPTARAFSGAAVAGGKIFVIGGWNGVTALIANEVYYPQRDGTGEVPWEQAEPLPEGRYGMGVVSLAENVYVLGGEGRSSSENCLVISSARLAGPNLWQGAADCPAEVFSQLVSIPYQTSILVLGGLRDGILSSQSVRYNVLYTVSFPLVR